MQDHNIFMKSKLFFYTALIGIIIFNLLIVYVFYMLVYPFKIVNFTNFSTTKDSYKAGENVCVDIEFVKSRALEAEVSWYYVDSVVYKIDGEDVIYRPVGYNKTVRCFPAVVPPAKYKLQVEITYTILNGLRELKYSEVSNEFLITK